MTKNQLPIDQLDLRHCLRREFTLNIIRALIHKRLSINLIGEKGTGKTRLLEDIINCKLPDTVIVFVNLKSYVSNYKGLLREIHSQLEIGGKVPERLHQLFEGLEKQPVRYLVFLDNYDALLDNPGNDDGFDVNFFDDLNFIKNKDNICLLCTTCKPHNSQPVFINKKSYRNSWLILEKEMLPPLSRREILQELERQVDEYEWLWLKANLKDKELVLEYVQKLPLPYPRLCFLKGKLNKKTDEEIEIKFKKRLSKWMEEFNKLNKISVDKKIHILKTWMDRKRILMGIKKLKIPAIIAAAITAIWIFIKKKCGI
ncbi:MAG: ATP-binding protein [Candidatus Aminicenantes bacterium]|nr:MAG: ATP-binding protein [Candidatus Aminicenantes bacterium]